MCQNETMLEFFIFRTNGHDRVCTRCEGKGMGRGGEREYFIFPYFFPSFWYHISYSFIFFPCEIYVTYIHTYMHVYIHTYLCVCVGVCQHIY